MKFQLISKVVFKVPLFFFLLMLVCTSLMISLKFLSFNENDLSNESKYFGSVRSIL